MAVKTTNAAGGKETPNLKIKESQSEVQVSPEARSRILTLLAKWALRRGQKR